MARLAADVYLVESCLVTACCRIVAFNHIRAVTLRAPTVPVVVNASPVKWTIRGDSVLPFVYVIPPLTTLRLTSAIPSYT